VAFSIKIHH